MNSIDSIKESFVEFCHLLYKNQLVSGFGGNISIKTKNLILTTPTGLSLRDIAIDDIVHVKANGDVLKGDKKPTREFLMHSRIFDVREEINVVCHCHGKYLVAASSILTPSDNCLPPLTPGFNLFAYPLPMIPFFMPGSIELANVVGSFFLNLKTMGLLLQNHGLISVGADFTHALNIAEEINEAAAVYVLTHGKSTNIPQEVL